VLIWHDVCYRGRSRAARLKTFRSSRMPYSAWVGTPPSSLRPGHLLYARRAILGPAGLGGPPAAARTSRLALAALQPPLTPPCSRWLMCHGTAGPLVRMRGRLQ